MDAQWIGVGLTAVVVTVSLAMFIRAGLAGIREDYVRLEGAHHRSGPAAARGLREVGASHRPPRGKAHPARGKAGRHAERVARIEGILVRQWTPDLEATPAQAVPGEAPETR